MKHVFLDMDKDELPVMILRRRDVVNVTKGIARCGVVWLEDDTGRYEYWDGKRYRVKQEHGGFTVFYRSKD